MRAKRKSRRLKAATGYMGKVRKGTVVLPAEADLPEGTVVRVEPIAADSLAARLKKVIGIVRDMPADWAENHNHYIPGAPKK